MTHSASRARAAGTVPWLALGLLLVAALPSPAAPSDDAPAAATRALVAPGEPADLIVWNRPILTLRASIGQTSPAERVQRALQRIQAIPDSELTAPPHALPAQVGELRGLMVFAGTRQLFNILHEDLDPESTETLEAVGATTVRHLQEVFAARAAQRSLPLLLHGLAAAAIATALFALVTWALAHSQRWLLARLTVIAERRGGATVRQLRGTVAELVRRTVQVAVAALALFAAYLWLTFVLSQFPYTAPWGGALGWRLRHVLGTVATGIVASLPDVLTVVVIFAIARMVVRALHSLFAGVEQRRLSVPGIQPETAEATRRISTVLVWLFAITVAYPYIPGSETDAFRGVSVFVGLMVSLGSAGLVNQVMSGLVVVYARAIRPGEYVRIGEVEGVVTEVGLLSTKVATVRKEEVTVPNAVMITQAMTNYSRLADRDGAVISTSVTIGYDAPWRQVHALLCLAAERTEDIRRDPPPRVAQRQLADFYVEYVLLASIDQPVRRFAILAALHANIQDAFNEHGVQIMSPHFVAQPAAPVVVPKEKWHDAPAQPDAPGHSVTLPRAPT